MGRLDDIAARNRKAMGADSALVQVVGKLGDGKPANAAPAFTLPSQRKSGTAVWKVLILMLLLGTAIGLYTCHQMELQRADDERRLGR